MSVIGKVGEEMNNVDIFIYKISNDYGIVNCAEEEKMINDATNLIYRNSNKEEVEAVVRTLITRFIGGYNAYKDIDEFLECRMKDEWEQACQEVAERNNYGWDMSVKQLLENLRR